jgi:hypothetical protein
MELLLLVFVLPLGAANPIARERPPYPGGVRVRK